jgi:KDO2-lipid IV(A) lauroyltransferase
MVPRHWLFLLSDALAKLSFAFFRGFRVRSIANVSAAFAERVDSAGAQAVARRSLRNFFRAFVEMLIALETSDDALRLEIPISGREHLDAALAKGNGAIVLSAHLGNFFLLGTRLAIEGYSTHVLVNQPRGGQFAKLMDDYRLQIRQRTIHARPRPEALGELNRVLRQNELAVIIADEYRRGNGIRVPLFGRTVSARRGPATLGLRTGAAIVPACMVRQRDDSLRLVIEPELELVHSGKSKAEVRENTLRMTQWVERTVETYPDQWNWMNVRWRDNSSSALLRKGHRVEEATHEIKKGNLW